MFQRWTLDKALPWLMVIFGVIGTLCAAVITIEKMDLLANPNYKPICDINPIISCGSVMASEQSHVFGFSNPIIGLIAFPIIVTTGVALLQKNRFKRWYWLSLQIGLFAGVIFCHYLFFQAVYRINALCPWCIVVWISTISLFWYMLLYNLSHDHIKPPRQLIGFALWLRKHHLDILLFWFVVLAFFIIKHFWYYFGDHLF